jgi:hypothetical protein
VIPRFHEWLQATEFFSWLKRRILDAASEMQELIKGLGFDLPLLEAWQSDMSPFISVAAYNRSTNNIDTINYGIGPELYLNTIGELVLSNNLIAYHIQAGNPVGMWYAPYCDEVTRAPITPNIFIMPEADSEAHSLSGRLIELIVFESLLEQIGARKGISCPLRTMYEGGCCGYKWLMWSIYEAGMKAREELGWQRIQWVEPECSKTDNSLGSIRILGKQPQ